jgi:hypothetical protein
MQISGEIRWFWPPKETAHSLGSVLSQIHLQPQRRYEPEIEGRNTMRRNIDFDRQALIEQLFSDSKR